MGNLRRPVALRFAVVLLLLTSALSVPATASAVAVCTDPTPPARSHTVYQYNNIKVVLRYSYVTCTATLTVENRSAGPLSPNFAMSIWERAGVCDQNAPNGTKLAQWDGGILWNYPHAGYTHTISAPSSPGRCFRGYFVFGCCYAGGTDLWVPLSVAS